MKLRDVTTSINSCYECPNLDSIDGYDEHAYHCTLLERTTIKITPNTETFEEAHAMLTDWFNNLCPLPLTKE